MKIHSYTLAIRVLICKEDDQFVAHALEMDILGYGASEREALSELKTLLNNQIGFSASVGHPEMINFPAPKEFFERWEKANAARLKDETASEKSVSLLGKSLILVFSGEDLARLRRTAAQKAPFPQAERLLEFA